MIASIRAGGGGRWLLFCILGWLILACPRVALADDPTTEPAAEEKPAAEEEPAAGEEPGPSPQVAAYQRHLALGIRLFEDRNYDAAMAEFERAYAKQRRASPLINIALCHKGRFEYVKAIAALERALREHRDTVGDPEKITRAIDEMRELLGEVDVKITPRQTDARLYLDGEALPRASARSPFEVSPGRHVLVARADGFAEARHELRVASGETLTVKVALRPDRGELVFEASHDRVRVSVDGQLRGQGDLRVELSPGTHLLELVHGEERYSASFAVVSGEPSRVVLDENGLLHVGNAGPRGPDAVVKPPISGFYVLTIFDIGPRFGDDTDLRIAPGARIGYRIMSGVGVEAEFHQVFNMIESNERNRVVGTTMGRLNARLMTSTLPARFVTTLGLGYAHDFDEEGSGNGFSFLVEPGFDIELSNLILGLATPIVVGVTSLNGGTLTFDLGGGLRLGYGFW